MIVDSNALTTQNRKADHLRVCLEDDVQFHQTTTGLEHYRFTHCCLPELDRHDINLSTTFLGKQLGAPLLISSMTGGTDLAKTINYRLAEAATALWHCHGSRFAASGDRKSAGYFYLCRSLCGT